MESSQFLGLLIAGLLTIFSFLGVVVGFMYKYIFVPQMKTSRSLDRQSMAIEHQNELQAIHNARQDGEITQIGDNIFIINGKIQRLEDVVFKKDYSTE